MKAKKFFAFSLVLALLLSLLCISAAASSHDVSADSSDDVTSTVNFINSNFTSDEFGGIYYDGDTLVVNVVDSTDFWAHNSAVQKIDSNIDVEYRMVKYSLQELENVKEFLTPLMHDFEISILDANEVTNQVDIFLSNYDEEIIEDIKAYVAENLFNIDFLNFIDNGDKVLVSTVAYDLSASTFDVWDDVILDEAGVARTRYFPGAGIIIGNGGYTLGPALSSSQAYSAGHGFHGTVNIYDSIGLPIGRATSHYGGSSGDWSSVNIYDSEYYPVVKRGTPISGTRVYMIGAVSGETSGKINKTNISVAAEAPYATLTGMCSGTYSCKKGDSGAGIFSQGISDLINSSNGITYGIQSSALFLDGDWAGESFFTPISKVY